MVGESCQAERTARAKAWRWGGFVPGPPPPPLRHKLRSCLPPLTSASPLPSVTAGSLPAGASLRLRPRWACGTEHPLLRAQLVGTRYLPGFCGSSEDARVFHYTRTPSGALNAAGALADCSHSPLAGGRPSALSLEALQTRRHQYTPEARLYACHWLESSFSSSFLFKGEIYIQRNIRILTVPVWLILDGTWRSIFYLMVMCSF